MLYIFIIILISATLVYFLKPINKIIKEEIVEVQVISKTRDFHFETYGESFFHHDTYIIEVKSINQKYVLDVDPSTYYQFKEGKFYKIKIRKINSKFRWETGDGQTKDQFVEIVD